ncbi:hypothetical protein LRS10_17895 [Phenylobacterium sp. J426]|uniref:hypothetical protein n=1 Tax=Phenylobacterium sp. J426 TaxID=2898439 RepID=UPI002151871F|nr:hypothetical protein [Phenylobacterium sp. J426]MCR5875870.1 hypothetical protein [Phenylobacterium sp. J426]
MRDRDYRDRDKQGGDNDPKRDAVAGASHGARQVGQVGARHLHDKAVAADPSDSTPERFGRHRQNLVQFLEGAERAGGQRLRFKPGGERPDDHGRDRGDNIQVWIERSRKAFGDAQGAQQEQQVRRQRQRVFAGDRDEFGDRLRKPDRPA